MAKFGAESKDYDWDSVKDWEKETGESWEDRAMMLDDGKKHYPSRLPSGKNEGLLLKGRKHKTWDLLERGEREANMEIFKGPDGKYHSKPKDYSSNK